MAVDRRIRQLAKTLAYILGRHPDSYGLIPDENGWVRIRDLLKALSEEPDLRWVKKGACNEILFTLTSPPIEIQEEWIRAVDRNALSEPVMAQAPPKLLFTCVRERAWPHVAKKGLYPQPETPVLISPSREMALRLGQRKDKNAVLLTIRTGEAMAEGVVFTCHGEALYSAPFLPTGVYAGPPLPAEGEEKPAKKARSAKKPAPKKEEDFMPGSFLPKQSSKTGTKGKEDRDKTSWKNNKKRLRKESFRG